MMWGKKITKTATDILTYMIEEDFSQAQMDAVKVIVTTFNFSDGAEGEVFAFAEHLIDDYDMETGGK